MKVNGKNASANAVKMVITRCIGSCLTSIPNATEVITQNTTLRLWSDPKEWPNNTVPQEGANITIPRDQSWVFDLAESPVYNYIELNGNVTFK